MIERLLTEHLLCARHFHNESPWQLDEVSFIFSLEVLKLKVGRGGIWPTRISAPSSLFRATKLQYDLKMIIPRRGALHPPPILNLRKQEGSRLKQPSLVLFLTMDW